MQPNEVIDSGDLTRVFKRGGSTVARLWQAVKGLSEAWGPEGSVALVAKHPTGTLVLSSGDVAELARSLDGQPQSAGDRAWGRGRPDYEGARLLYEARRAAGEPGWEALTIVQRTEARERFLAGVRSDLPTARAAQRLAMAVMAETA